MSGRVRIEPPQRGAAAPRHRGTASKRARTNVHGARAPPSLHRSFRESALPPRARERGEMRAVTYRGRKDVRVEDHPEPQVESATDAVVEVTATCICGSDLHLYHGLVPRLEKGDTLGHEFVGVVRDVGEDVEGLREGDRVVVPFVIACGACDACERGQFALCETTNHGMGAALFGYTRMYGGVPGGQAERVRVPRADVGPEKLPAGVSDEQGALLADALPTGYQAAAIPGVDADATVAVLGAGPVGLMTILAAKKLLGAKLVIAIDREPGRLEMARRVGADETIDFESARDVGNAVRALTDGKGAHVSVDAVGFEAVSPKGVASTVEKAGQLAMLSTGSLTAFRWAVDAARWGGAVSVPGVYAQASAQMFPWGRIWEKGLRVHTGQTHVHAHLPVLLEAVADGVIDPAAIVTHRASLDEARDLYRAFDEDKSECVKVVLRP